MALAPSISTAARNAACDLNSVSITSAGTIAVTAYTQAAS